MKFSFRSAVFALSFFSMSAFANVSLVDGLLNTQGFSHLELSHWENTLFVSARTQSSTFGVEESLDSPLADDLCRLAERTGISSFANCSENFEGTFGLKKSELSSLETFLKQPHASLFFEMKDGKVVAVNQPTYVPTGKQNEFAKGNTFAETVLRFKGQ